MDFVLYEDLTSSSSWVFSLIVYFELGILSISIAPEPLILLLYFFSLVFLVWFTGLEEKWLGSSNTDNRLARTPILVLIVLLFLNEVHKIQCLSLIMFEYLKSLALGLESTLMCSFSLRYTNIVDLFINKLVFRLVPSDRWSFYLNLWGLSTLHFLN